MDRQKNRNILRRLTHQIFQMVNRIPLLRVPLKNKGLRYKVFLLLSPFSFLLFCFSSCDPEEMIVNKTWHLDSTLVNGELYTDSTQFNIIPKYTYYFFGHGNVLEIKTIVDEQQVTSPNGKYFFKDRSTLKLEFTLKYQKYKIDSVNIVKLTNKEMNLEYNYKGNTYFLKFFPRN